MVKIHGIAYLIIGVLVTASSYYIDKQKLIVFFYIGLIMIGIGIAKLVVKSISGSANKTKRPVQQGSQVCCQFCGSKINYAGNYCHFCGGRIR